MAPSSQMSELRTWSEPIDKKSAEMLFSRFVRSETRRRAGDQTPQIDSTKHVSSPNLPSRRRDEATATFNTSKVEPDVDELRQRRLLGLNDLEATLSEKERRELLSELKALYRHGHIDDVVMVIERTTREYPYDLELLGGLSDLFLSSGDLLRGITMLFSMVDAFFERANPAAARRCLERIQSLDPENKRLKSFEKLLNP